MSPLPCNIDSSLTIIGSENFPTIGPLIIAVNHDSWLSRKKAIPWLLTQINQIDFKPLMLSAKIFKIFAWLIKLFKQPYQPLFLSRNYDLNDFEILNHCVAHLKKGGVVIIAPEGKRNHGKLRRGKEGVAYLALNSKAKVLPVAIYRSPRKSKWKFFRSSVTTLIIGKARQFKSMKQPTILELTHVTNEIMKEIALLLPEDRRGVYKEMKP